MSKKYIISIEEKENYPFDGPMPTFQLVVVRITHAVPKGVLFQQLKGKLDALLRLPTPFLVTLLRVRQARGLAFQIDYEYISEGLAKSPKAYEGGFLAATREKLQQFGAILAEEGIRADLRMQNIGLDEAGDPKIFLGLDFQLVQESERKVLALEYQSAIDRLLESNFGFRNSLHAHSDTQKSDYSHRLDKRLTEMEGKINKLRLRRGQSSKQSSSESSRKSDREPNIVLQAVSHESNNSSFTAGTSYSVIANPQARPKVHKSSFGDYSTSSYRLNEESVRDDSLKKRVNHALEKTQEAFKIYQKYSRRKRRI